MSDASREKSGSNSPSELSAAEVDARREAGLKKLLAMPPKPRKPKGGDKEAIPSNSRARPGSDPKSRREDRD